MEPVRSFLYRAIKGMVLPASSISITACTCSGLNENSFAKMDTKSIQILLAFVSANAAGFIIREKREKRKKKTPRRQRGEREDAYFAMAWVSSQPQLISF